MSLALRSGPQLLPLSIYKSAFPAPTQVKFPQAGEQKRKRERLQESEDPPNLVPFESLRKQRRTSLTDAAVKGTCDQRATSGIHDNKPNLIDYWSKERRWPEEYCNQDDQTRIDLEKYNGIYWVTEMGLNHLLARRKSSSSLRAKQSEAGSIASSSTTPSDQKQRETKSTPYARLSYTTVLATKGSFMDKSDLGITDASKKLCRILLEKEQTVPQVSLFRNDVFDKACRDTGQERGKGSSRYHLIDRPFYGNPSHIRCHTSLSFNRKCYSNEGWNSAEPFYGESLKDALNSTAL